MKQVFRAVPILLVGAALNLFATTTTMPYSASLTQFRTSIFGEVSLTVAAALLVGVVLHALMVREINSTLVGLLVAVVMFGTLGVADIWFRGMFAFTGAVI